MNIYRPFSKLAFAFCFGLLPLFCLGQEQLGLRLDNYQGIHTIFINPANSATQALNWNLNLLGAGIFMENNYAFLKNTSIRNAINSTIIYSTDVPSDGTVGENEVVLDFNERDSKKFLDVNGFITGPSFMGHINQHHFGAFINYRVHASEQDLDQDLGYYTNSNIAIGQPFEVDRTRFSAMLWREIGVHYAYSKATYFGEIVIGTNIKYLSGLEGISLDSKRLTVLQRIALEELETFGVDAEVIGTTPVFDMDNIAQQSKGNGLGFDIGFSAIFQDYEDSYKFKIGLAVNDIGKISFNNAVEAHVFQSLNNINFNKNDYLDIADLRDLIQRASANVLGDPTTSLDPSTSSFDIKLPSNLVVTTDYKISETFFVSGLFVQRLSSPGHSLEKSNILAITPRFETKWIGAALPISNINFARTHVGLSLRLAFLTIGTDQLGSLLSKSKLSGGDAYIALQLFGFGNGGLFGGLFQNKNSEKTGCFDM